MTEWERYLAVGRAAGCPAARMDEKEHLTTDRTDHTDTETEFYHSGTKSREQTADVQVAEARRAPLRLGGAQAVKAAAGIHSVGQDDAVA